MSLEELIKLKVGRLEDVPTNYSNGIKNVQRDIMDGLLDALESLSRDSKGNIRQTQQNLLVIEEISIDLKRIFTESEYLSLTKEFISEFGNQADISDLFFKKAFGEVFIDDFNRKALDVSKNQAYELMASTPIITKNLYQPVKTLLIDAVISGDSYTKTVGAIRQVVKGGTIKDKKLEGKLYSYAKQMAFDTFAVADRGYTNNIAQDLDVEWYGYIGGLVEDSRPFCVTRNSNFYHKKEVESWGDLKGWNGKIPSTDTKTIFIYAGGYRCNHSILPTSIAIVPIADIQRNIANGNFKPSKTEKKMLKLI